MENYEETVCKPVAYARVFRSVGKQTGERITFKTSTMENWPILEKLKLFVEEERYEYPFIITKDTTIEKDLKITGDDAMEFMISYSNEFHVDVSNFMAADYFSPEGTSFLFPDSKKRKILTIGDLEKGVIAGRLDESVISNVAE
jgi:hypothetical protein